MENKPLADIYRPENIKDIVGQSHLLGKDCLFRRAISNKNLTNMIFYGPPGTGKTTLANIIAKNSGLSLHKLNGTSATIEDIKNVINESKSLFNQKRILLYLDEIQYLNKKQQQSLLEFVENGDIKLIASTTENPYFYIYPALISRCTVFEFKSIQPKDIEKGLKRITVDLGLKIEKEAISKIALSSAGDMRKAINNLEFLINGLSKAQNEITLKMAEELLVKSSIHYDSKQDMHFDTLSALMKSLRGSDPDASVFYLAKMLEAGDLIAASRRLLCSASEDVGLAYPNIIPIVKSCVDTALQLGLPEARLPLTNAAILIATAPKSNSSYLAYAKALEDIKMGKGISFPRHLQNTHFDGEDALVKGQNYLYPHDFANHYVKQQYLPNDIKDARYYFYQNNKFEKALKDYWDKIKF